MKGNRRRDTAPELAVRRMLHARGARFRVDHRLEPDLRTRPDIVFTRRRIAIYIDGCFWHGCPDHVTYPKANADYWLPKLERNRERDRKAASDLVDRGWRVLRFWEHEEPADVVEMILACMR